MSGQLSLTQTIWVGIRSNLLLVFPFFVNNLGSLTQNLFAWLHWLNQGNACYCIQLSPFIRSGSLPILEPYSLYCNWLKCLCQMSMLTNDRDTSELCSTTLALSCSEFQLSIQHFDCISESPRGTLKIFHMRMVTVFHLLQNPKLNWIIRVLKINAELLDKNLIISKTLKI